MQGNHVECSNNGMTVKKIGQSGWFRTFANKAFSKGYQKWSLNVGKYGSSDKSGITFGVCTDDLFNSQKDKT